MEEITAWLYDLYAVSNRTEWSNEEGRDGGYVVFWEKNIYVSLGKIAGPSGRAV
jgi:hypothetical protein